MQVYQTLAELTASRQNKTGTLITCRENFGFYIVQDSGYTPTGSDITVANGRVVKFEFAFSALNIKTTGGNVQGDLDSIISGGLPTQSGNKDRVLTTDGTSASWTTVGLEFATTAEMQAVSPTVDGIVAYNQQRANAKYILSTTATAQPGDITAANGNVWVLQDLENFRAYGDIDDSADCGPLIETVLNSGRSNIYKFRGNFTVDTPSEINGISDLTIDCYGAYFDCSSMYGSDVGGIVDGMISFNGSQYGSTTITTDIAYGERSFTVSDGTQIKEGDGVYILSDGELMYTEGANALYKRLIATISSVSGNTVTINEYFPFSIDATTHTVTITSWDQVCNIRVLGGEFFGGFYRRNISNGVGIGAFTANYIKGFMVKDATIKGFENIAIWPRYGQDIKVLDCKIQGHEANYPEPTEGVDSGFYGVLFNTCRGVLMRGVTGFRVRHLQDAAHSSDMKVMDCHSVDSHRGAFGCHNGTYDGLYIGCTANGRQAGVQWRGMNLHVDSCVFESFVSGSCIYDSEGSASDLPSYRKVTNCELKAARAGVNFIGGNIDVTISGCDIVGGYESSGYSPVYIEGPMVRSCSINNNARISTGTDSGVAVYVNPDAATLITINNNYIKSDLNLIRILSSASTLRFNIIDNILDSDGSGLYDINITNSQIVETLRDNYRLDGTAATRNP